VTVFDAMIRIDTPQEVLYYRHGGILQYVLRQLVAGKEEPVALSGGVSTAAAAVDPGADKDECDEKVTEGSMESFPASDAPGLLRVRSARCEVRSGEQVGG
jgi:aconitate hydratase